MATYQLCTRCFILLLFWVQVVWIKRVAAEKKRDKRQFSMKSFCPPKETNTFKLFANLSSSGNLIARIDRPIEIRNAKVFYNNSMRGAGRPRLGGGRLLNMLPFHSFKPQQKKEDVIKKKLGSYSVNRANDITTVQETRPSIASEKGETRQMAVLLRLSRVLSNRRGVATIDR